MHERRREARPAVAEPAHAGEDPEQHTPREQEQAHDPRARATYHIQRDALAPSRASRGPRRHEPLDRVWGWTGTTTTGGLVTGGVVGTGTAPGEGGTVATGVRGRGGVTTDAGDVGAGPGKGVADVHRERPDERHGADREPRRRARDTAQPAVAMMGS